MCKRKFSIIAAIAASVIAVVSCNKSETNVYDVNPKSIKAAAEGYTAKITVTSNTAWSLSSDRDWVTFSPSSGEGSMEVTVTVAKNGTKYSRVAMLGIIGQSGSTVVSVQISQEAQKSEIDNIIMAHRGAYAEYGHPDNSLAALNQAIELGVYGSECDINITTDNQVIVVHGDTFGGLPVLHNSYSTLRAKAKLKNNEPLPLLADFLKAVMAGGGTKLVIDVKSLSDEAGGNAQSIRAGVAAAQLIKRLGAQDRVMFIIGRIGVFNGVIDEVDGQWPVAYMNSALTPEEFLEYTKGRSNWGNFDITAFGKNPATDKFDPKYADQQLNRWRDAGVELTFYNIDTEDQIGWYLPHKEDLKVCSNYPLKLLQRVGKR